MPGLPGQASKKKQGKAPAHQNKFAFQHNPKSRMTAKILSSPNVHLCRRCHEKIEWRKQYRKYKPRTQPGTCNGCQKRNVKAAYHTICTNCTQTFRKAQVVIQQEWEREQMAALTTKIEQSQTETEAETTMTTVPPKSMRACAMCVKEIALPDPADEQDDDSMLSEALSRIKLRERKTIERKLERSATKTRRKGKSDEDGDNEDNEQEAYSCLQQQQQQPQPPEQHPNELMVDDSDDDNDTEEEDPFLIAVGGAEKLLTGAAYQQKLLEEAEQRKRAGTSATMGIPTL